MTEAVTVTVAQALDQIDRAFGPRTGRTSPIDGCRHCFTEAELADLCGPPARIADSKLFHAVFRWGNTLDDSVQWMRWITPRLLRDMMQNAHLPDDELIGARLNKAGWQNWPPAERQAIETLCTAWWKTTLTSPVDEWSAPQALTFLVPLTRDLTPWLHTWTHTPGRPADLQIANLWHTWGQEILTGHLDISVYADGPNIAPALSTWLIHHATPRLAPGDLDELATWSLAQLPLPENERWR